MKSKNVEFDNVQVIDNNYIDATFPDIPLDLISRDSEIDLITKTLEKFNVVFLEGEKGVGKTTCLVEFAKMNSFNSISHFITLSYSFSYSPICVKDNLFRQIYFYIYEKELSDDIQSIDDTFFTSLNNPLLKKIRRDHRPLYFIFDGISDIPSCDIDTLRALISQLPFGKAKFIFSNSLETKNLESILPINVSVKPILLSNFSLSQTKEYFKNFQEDDANIIEIHKLCNKGLPEKLSLVKRLCMEQGGIMKFLKSEISNDTDLFGLDWSKVDECDDTQKIILATIAFDETKFKIADLSIVLGFSKEVISEKVKKLSFINIAEDGIFYISETHKAYAQKKLHNLKDKVLTIIINYYEQNPNIAERTFNLPNLYEKAKRWKDITKLLSIDAFIQYLEKYQSIASVKRQFDYGIDASKNISETTDHFGDYFRFTLHKSSFKELEKYEMWENEAEARLALDEYSQALNIANSAFLKEDKLRLLAILAKQRNENKLPTDPNLMDQINDTYKLIDFTDIKEKGFELAGILIYSCFDLAIDLIEKLTDNSDGNNSLDIALAQLSMYMVEATRNNKSAITDIDLINSKIKNDDIKNIATGLKYISSEYNVSEIIEHAHKLKNVNKKIFLLRGWILNNKTNPDVVVAIEFTLNEIIKSSSHNVPNATTLSQIALPLPLIKNFESVNNLISLFDSQKSTITVPTKDYVKLQLTIAEAQFNYDIDKSKDRIFEVFFLIEDEIKDLSIKTDCLSLLWLKLLKLDLDHSIESAISSSSSLESQIKKNIDKLLGETALHYRMVDFVMKTIVAENPIFVYNFISDLNTIERRDAAFRESIIHYIQVNDISKIDFNIIDQFLDEIDFSQYREHVVIELIIKCYDIKELALPFINKIIKYKNNILYISNIENKCFAITRMLKILGYDKVGNSKLIQEFLDNLNLSWSIIDIQWRKIEIGFLIAKELSDFSREDAIKYLHDSSKLKEDEPLSSDSVVKTYMLSARLCIRAFGGLLFKVQNFESYLNQLIEIVNHVQSSGEKLKLYNEVALLLYSNKHHSFFNKIVRENILPLLSLVNDSDKSYKNGIIVDISASLFLNNSVTYFELLSKLPEEIRNMANLNACNFLIHKLIYDEPIESEVVCNEIEYEEYVNICLLISNITNDYNIFRLVSKVCENIKVNKNKKISAEQKNDLKARLNKIVATNLPNATRGIAHEGYKIIAETEILHIDPYGPALKSKWDNLIQRTKSIANISDRALVLSSIAERIDNNKIQRELLEEAFNYISSISANYEKSNRFGAVLEIWWKKSEKGLFDKYWDLAFKSIIEDKDGNYNNVKNLIDIAQQHNPKLAESAITILDKDPARFKYKNALLKRMENNKTIKSACTDFKTLSKLNNYQVGSVFQKNLSQLNAGKLSTKDVNDTLEILAKISTMGLSDAYDAISFFIQNIIIKSKPKTYKPDMLQAVFHATYLNAKLVATLSADNTNKMKNLYSSSIGNVQSANPVIRYGEKDIAIEYITSWIGNNVKKQLIIIDPYFTENELEFLKIVNEFDSKIIVTVLTSKMNKNNSGSNNRDVYQNKWESISAEIIPETTIIIVFDSGTNKCPFHDRWWIADEFDAGFMVPSVGGIGSRDSQIIEMNKEALQNAQQIVNDYIYRREKRVKGFNLKYEYFELGV